MSSIRKVSFVCLVVFLVCFYSEFSPKLCFMLCLSYTRCTSMKCGFQTADGALKQFVLQRKVFSIGYKRWERFGRTVDGYQPHKLNDRQMEKRENMRHFARSVQKGVVFATYSYRGWKVDLFWEYQAQKIMGRPRRIVHIDRKTESLWHKHDVLC